MAIEYEIPSGWTEDDVRRYLKPNERSGTYSLGEEVQTVEVEEIQEGDQ